MASEISKLSVIAAKQLVEWGIGPGKFYLLPYQKEARRSAYSYSHRQYQKELRKVRKQFPASWSESMITNFIGKNTYALDEYHDEILQAAKRNDIEFFISLGEIVKKQRDGKTSFAQSNLEPQGCIGYTAYFWTKGLLWLMTDTAALQFLNLVIGKTFPLDAYRIARRRLKVFKHPESPIVSVEKSSLATVGKKGDASPAKPIYRLKLKRRWNLVEGRITKA